MYSRAVVIWYDVNRVSLDDAEALRAAHPPGVVVATLPNPNGVAPLGIAGEPYPTPAQLFQWTGQERT